MLFESCASVSVHTSKQAAVVSKRSRKYPTKLTSFLSLYFLRFFCNQQQAPHRGPNPRLLPLQKHPPQPPTQNDKTYPHKLWHAVTVESLTEERVPQNVMYTPLPSTWLQIRPAMCLKNYRSTRKKPSKNSAPKKYTYFTVLWTCLGAVVSLPSTQYRTQKKSKTTSKEGGSSKMTLLVGAYNKIYRYLRKTPHSIFSYHAIPMRNLDTATMSVFKAKEGINN